MSSYQQPKLTGHNNSILTPVKDTGYTKLCPVCAIRHGQRLDMIGKDRAIEIVRCVPCAGKPLRVSAHHGGSYSEAYKRRVRRLEKLL